MNGFFATAKREQAFRRQPVVLIESRVVLRRLLRKCESPCPLLLFRRPPAFGECLLRHLITLKCAVSHDRIRRQRTLCEFSFHAVHIEGHKRTQLMRRRGGPEEAIGQIHNDRMRGDEGIKRAAMAIPGETVPWQFPVSKD